MSELKITESMIKSQIKDLLALKGIFSFPVTQGLGSYRGIPDRCMHYRGKVVFLEIKTPAGKLSEHQEAFWRQCLDDKVAYWVIRSIEDLESHLQEGK